MRRLAYLVALIYSTMEKRLLRLTGKSILMRYMEYSRMPERKRRDPFLKARR